MNDAAVAEIGERLDAVSPRTLLVLTPNAHAARWLERMLLDRGPLVGLLAMDLERLLAEGSTVLRGDPISDHDLLSLVGVVLGEDDHFARIAGDVGYRRRALDLFTELDRLEGLGAGEADLSGGTGTEAALLRAHRRFRDILEQRSPHRWYGGLAAGLLVEGRSEIPFVRDAAEVLAVGFDRPAAWEERLLEALGAHRVELPRPDRERSGRPLDQWVCGGPHVERVEVARLLKRERTPTAVYVPAEEVGSWSAALTHRDVPHRAWVSRPAWHTAVARVLRASLRLVTEERVRRDDLEEVLFGPGLRPWPSGDDAPRVGRLRRVWGRLRRGSGTWTEWRRRLDAVADRMRGELEDQAARYGWEPDDLDTRREDALRCVSALHEALGALEGVATARDLGRLLSDWGLRRAARSQGTPGGEAQVAEGVHLTLAVGGDTPIEAFAGTVEDSLRRSSAGHWVDERVDGNGEPVWLVPHGLRIPTGRGRIVLAGLDSVPAPPQPDPLISEETRAALGLRTARSRYEADVQELERAAGAAEVLLTWRSRDGAGGDRTPAPWVALRHHDRKRRLGVDRLTPATDTPVVCALDAHLAAPDADEALARRRAAVRAHAADQVGPWTGDLGVSVRPDRPYSVSSLQRYARLPYLYFLERVLGLLELDEAEDALDAMEQGSIVHDFLERTWAEPLRAAGQPLDLRDWDGALDEEALTETFREAAHELLADAVWEGEAARWHEEVMSWWEDWSRRLTKGSKNEALVPGPLVAGLELSFGPLELELHDGVRVTMRGFIDRLEMDPERERLMVVDYKTGRGKGSSNLKTELRQGSHLQLPLYALALEAWLDADEEARHRHAGGERWRVGAVRLEHVKRGAPSASTRRLGGPKPAALASDEAVAHGTEGGNWSALETARYFAGHFVRAIEQGHFPVVRRVPAFFGAERSDEVLRRVPESGPRAGALPEALPEPEPEEVS